MAGLCSDSLSCLGLSDHLTLPSGDENIKSCRRISRHYHEQHRVCVLCCKQEPWLRHEASHYNTFVAFMLHLKLFFFFCRIQQTIVSLLKCLGFFGGNFKHSKTLHYSYGCICQQRPCSPNPGQKSGCIRLLPTIFQSLNVVLPTKSLVFSNRCMACNICIKTQALLSALSPRICCLWTDCVAQINCR